MVTVNLYFMVRVQIPPVLRYIVCSNHILWFVDMSLGSLGIYRYFSMVIFHCNLFDKETGLFVVDFAYCMPMVLFNRFCYTCSSIN